MSTDENLTSFRVCEVCGGKGFHQFVSNRNLELEGCSACDFIRVVKIPSPQEIKSLYSGIYYQGWGISGNENWGVKLKNSTFSNLLSIVSPYLKQKGNLLDIGCATGLLMGTAEDLGWHAYGIDLSEYSISKAKERFKENVLFGTMSDNPFATKKFQVITMIDLVEHDPNPLNLLNICKSRLDSGGFLVIGTPNTASLTARVFGKSWHHFKQEHLYYWSSKNIQKLLTTAGFSIIHQSPFKKTLNLEYIKNQVDVYPNPILTPLSKLILNPLPVVVRKYNFRVSIGEMLVIAKKQ